MATTPSKKGAGKKAKQRRIYLALGLVALAVVGYLWYRGRSSASLAASPSGASSSLPGSGLDSGGGASGGSGADAGTGLLSALSGENQSLIDALLKGEQGLLSLIGSSVGAPPPSVPEPQPQIPSAPPPAPAPTPAPQTAAPSLQATVAAGAASLVPQTAAPADLQVPLGPATSTIQYNPSAPVYNAPSIDQAAADIAASYGDTSGGQPTPVDNAAPSNEAQAIQAAAAYTPPDYSPPVYGITYGPPAGQRATSGSKGVQSIH